LTIPSFVPPAPPPIHIPDFYDSSAVPSPTSSLSTSASIPPSVSAVSPEVCRQAQAYLDEDTQQWTCGGCNKMFSDKYGAERHITSVGLKVTCRYCGSRVSALKSSRRRHFQRELCQKQGIQRGFTTRNEEDAFLEGY